MNIGSRIKELRQGKWNQTEFSELIGVSLNTLSKFENGKSDLPSESLKKAAELLKVSADYLLTGKETEKTISEEENEIIKIVRESPEIRELMKETVALKKKVINKLWQVTHKNGGGYANAA
jgi:transcriptional regulator with XRE-family HTH domain